MRTRFIGVCACSVLAIVSSVGATEKALTADLILTNGSIKAGKGRAEALAVRNGVIIKIGDRDAVAATVGPSTKVIDLGGLTVLPGLHDLHVHPMFAGLEHFTCGFAPGANPKVIADAVRSCVSAKRPGEWIEGGNWVAAVFAPGQQSRSFLDAIAPENPVLLNDESHHSVWVNSAALKLSGITRTTPNPPNGIIERDSRGDATGLLREAATSLVEAIMPPPSLERRRQALIWASRQMLSYGITSFTVASVREPDIGPLSALSEEGLIKQRVRGCIVWAPEPDAVRKMGERLIADRNNYARPRFNPDCVKIFLDGVPTESHTAAMLAPYVDGNGAGLDKGSLNIAPDVLNKAMAGFDRQGLHVKFHAAGDAAVREAIYAVAAARKTNGFGGAMHDVGHSTFVAPADIERLRDVQMAWEFSPYIWYPTPIAEVDIVKAVGAERMKRWIPIKDALETGALVVVGSDWSVVPSVNPWLAIETLVSRQKPGGSAETLGVGQRIDLEAAFRLFTENGALLMGQRDQVGSIDVGMRADLIVTATDPFKVPITEVNRTKVMMTFIDGENVYDSSMAKPD
jgi:predicted amidohydrolase YtcJ